jgi:hypothetical protein
LNLQGSKEYMLEFENTQATISLNSWSF